MLATLTLLRGTNHLHVGFYHPFFRKTFLASAAVANVFSLLSDNISDVKWWDGKCVQLRNWLLASSTAHKTTDTRRPKINNWKAAQMKLLLPCVCVVVPRRFFEYEYRRRQSHSREIHFSMMPALCRRRMTWSTARFNGNGKDFRAYMTTFRRFRSVRSE